MAIRTYDTSPQAELAKALDGTILGPDAIRVGDRLITAGVTGVVRLNGTPLGMWSDGVDALAAAYRTAVAS